MKKLLILLLTLSLMITFVACQTNTADTDPQNLGSESPELDETENESPEPSQTETEGPGSDETENESPDADGTENESPEADETDTESPEPDKTGTENTDPGETESPKPEESETENPDPGETVTESPKPEETEQNGILEGSLEDILAKIYETAKVSDNFKEYCKTGLMTNEITAEKCEYYLGKADIEYEEAIASEPIMMPSAYELDLVRVKEGADVDKIKDEIKENVNPRKWICVGVDPENVIVDNIDDLIIVIMSNSEAKPLYDAFLALQES